MTGGKSTTRVTIRLPDDLLREIADEAKAGGVPRDTLIVRKLQGAVRLPDLYEATLRRVLGETGR